MPKRVTIRAGQFQTAFGAESGTVGRNDSNSAVIRLGGILRNDNFLAGIAEVAGTKIVPDRVTRQAGQDAAA
ncbi:hypothetical protein ACVIU4_003346 [Bradyrhizobium barranii subsp. barranii]